MTLAEAHALSLSLDWLIGQVLGQGRPGYTYLGTGTLSPAQSKNVRRYIGGQKWTKQRGYAHSSKHLGRHLVSGRSVFSLDADGSIIVNNNLPLSPAHKYGHHDYTWRGPETKHVQRLLVRILTSHGPLPEDVVFIREKGRLVMARAHPDSTVTPIVALPQGWVPCPLCHRHLVFAGKQSKRLCDMVEDD